MAFADEEAYGEMNIDYVRERLTDFDCMIVEDEIEGALEKLNAFSTLYSIRNGELLDGLIAFLKNCKKSVVTSTLLDEYENQKLAKSKKPANRSLNESNLNSERQILKELSLSLFTKSNLNDDEEGHLPSQDFDSSSFFEEHKKAKNRNVANMREDLGFPIKFNFTGGSYAVDNKKMAAATGFMDLPRHKIHSDLRSSSYLYGHSNIIFDIYEIMPDEEDNFDESIYDTNENNEVTLTGYVFPAEGGHLTFHNSTLITPRNAYALDFNKIDKVSLFPGMKLTAKSLLENQILHIQHLIPPEPLRMADLDYLTQYSHLKIFIACGPFCLGQDFERFSNLINTARNYGANAMILIGPFVPNNLNVQESPEEYFENLLASFVVAKEAKMRIYLVPNSQHDLMSMPYFPTPPIIVSDADDRKYKNLTSLPDPAIFELEGVNFAVSSSEILMHLCKKEIYKSSNMENEDRMQRLTSHLLSSRSLYPHFPADPKLSFSIQNSREKLQLEKKPHVLILPSMLQATAKDVEGCILINPGLYTRGKGAGTFALLEIDLHSAITSSSQSTTSTANNGTSISQFSEVLILAS